MLEGIKRTLGFMLTHKLAQRNMGKAMKELFLWQLQTLFSPRKYYLKNFASNLKVMVTKGQTGMTGNLYVGLHEFEEMAFLLHFLRSDDIFVDAGANVGSYTLLASGIVGARTVTFEPSPSTFSILENNIKLNHLDTLVEAHNKGLSSENGFLKFSTSNDTTNHVLSNDATNAVEVPVCTLDEIIGTRCPSLIKVDVEGYETEVLRGGEGILNNPTLKAIIIELNGSGNRYGFSDELIHRNLTSLGYQPAEYSPFSRSLVFKNSYGQTNTIYVRENSFVLDRIKNSKNYKIFGIEL